MIKRFLLVALILSCMIFMASGRVEHRAATNTENLGNIDSGHTIELSAITYPQAASAQEIIIEEPEEYLNQEEIELIALVTMAEAEGECEEGKRLVIDTILNRVDSEHFPDTVYQVIYQPNQFSSMWSGRVDRCWIREDICQLVREELKIRLNSDVIFFNAGRYSEYGKPLFQVENHYFSSYS